MESKLPSTKELAEIATDQRRSSHERRSAMKSLRESASPLAREIFLNVIESEDNQNLRESAIKGLGVVGVESDLVLLDSLKSSEASKSRFGAQAASNAHKELARKLETKASADAKVTDVLLIVHGIRDYAEWVHLVEDVFDGSSFRTWPVKFGYHNAIKFLLPWFGFDKQPTTLVLRAYRTAREIYPTSRISIIAHSYGTYITSKILENEYDVEFHKIVFCGSVVKQDFNWSAVRGKIGDPEVADKKEFIINERGDFDYWPVFAKAANWRYGTAGTDGFSSGLVTNRVHKGPHSLFLKNRKWIEDYWRSFFVDGKIEKGKAKDPRRNMGLFVTLFAAFIRILVIAVVLLGAYGAVSAVVGVFGEAEMNVTAEIDTVSLEYITTSLTSHLVSEIQKKDEAPDIGYDAMAVAQMRLALADDSPIADGDLIAFFESERVEGAWIHPAVKNQAHLGATAWTCFAYDVCGADIPNDLVDLLLQEQANDGWWAMFTGGGQEPHNASTYATCWVLRTLSAHARHQIAADRRADLDSAITRGIGWLLKNRDVEKCRWKDYPDTRSERWTNSEQQQQISDSVSAVVIWTLHDLIGNSEEYEKELMRLKRSWLQNLPETLPTPLVANPSDHWLTLGEERQLDKFLHYSLPWIVIATVVTYDVGSSEEKNNASRLLGEIVAQSELVVEEAKKHTWVSAENLFAFKYLRSNLREMSE